MVRFIDILLAFGSGLVLGKVERRLREGKTGPDWTLNGPSNEAWQDPEVDSGPILRPAEMLYLAHLIVVPRQIAPRLQPQ